MSGLGLGGDEARGGQGEPGAARREDFNKDTWRGGTGRGGVQRGSKDSDRILQRGKTGQERREKGEREDAEDMLLEGTQRDVRAGQFRRLVTGRERDEIGQG